MLTVRPSGRNRSYGYFFLNPFVLQATRGTAPSAVLGSGRMPQGDCGNGSNPYQAKTGIRQPVKTSMRDQAREHGLPESSKEALLCRPLIPCKVGSLEDFGAGRGLRSGGRGGQKRMSAAGEKSLSLPASPPREPVSVFAKGRVL